MSLFLINTCIASKWCNRTIFYAKSVCGSRYPYILACQVRGNIRYRKGKGSTIVYCEISWGFRWMPAGTPGVVFFFSSAAGDGMRLGNKPSTC